MKPFKETRIYTVGEDNGVARVRIEGQILMESGFEPHRPYRLKVNRKTIVLSLDAKGERLVNKHTLGPKKVKPLIVLHNLEMAAVLGGHSQAKATFCKGVITITPIA